MLGAAFILWWHFDCFSVLQGSLFKAREIRRQISMMVLDVKGYFARISEQSSSVDMNDGYVSRNSLRNASVNHKEKEQKLTLHSQVQKVQSFSQLLKANV